MIAKDIKMIYSPITLDWDFKWNVNDFELEGGLTTAVEMSLFTDRRAETDDELPDDGTDRQGWWGDLVLPTEDNDKIGSRLWLLRRSKTTDETLRLAETYAQEALEWMIKDKVVAKTECTAYRQGEVGSEVLGLEIKIYQRDGEIITLTYDQLWKES